MQTKTILFCFGILVALAGSAHAQSGDGERMKPKADVKRLGARSPVGHGCAQYGAGFVAVEGSNTCIKVGGSISVGVGTRR